MCSSNNAYVGSREFRAELVESPRRNTLLRAVNVESGDGRVMRGLFGKVGKLHALIAGDAAGAA